VLTLPVVQILRPLTWIDGTALSIWAGWYVFVHHGPNLDSLDDARKQVLALGVYSAPLVFTIAATILDITI
jgi:hypothetical protein